MRHAISEFNIKHRFSFKSLFYCHCWLNYRRTAGCTLYLLCHTHLWRETQSVFEPGNWAGIIRRVIIAIIISLFSSVPGTVGSNQDVTVAIFSLISASIVVSMPAEAPLEDTFFTVVITISLTVFLTGLFLFVLALCA